ncbi:diaminopimelate epimerase [Xanthomonas citri pv. aurantifolii str. ICPB 11122]|nr:diaminopimelate epimerase [Xanthomonas citri pv. aurantifolii str. ICPB 11122]
MRCRCTVRPCALVRCRWVNPHAVVEVGRVDALPVERLGALLLHNSAFPDSVNVGFAHVVKPGHVRLLVYHRCFGETLACGSGACAAAEVLMHLGHLERDVQVSLPGGELRIRWPGDQQQVVMSGPAVFVFDG